MTRGVDCTNFVSQSLYLGGWWIQRGPEQTTNQWYFRNAFPRDYSNSWTLVNNFRDFVVNSGRGIEIFPTRSEIWARPTRYMVGDVVQVDWEGEGTYDYTMLVTGVTSNNILLTYHNNNRLYQTI